MRRIFSIDDPQDAELTLVHQSLLCAFVVADASWLRFSWFSGFDDIARPVALGAIRAASAVAIAHPWYQERRHRLAWSEDVACLVDPTEELMPP